MQINRIFYLNLFLIAWAFAQAPSSSPCEEALREAQYARFYEIAVMENAGEQTLAIKAFRPKLADCEQWWEYVALTNGLARFYEATNRVDSALFYSDEALALVERYPSVFSDREFPAINAFHNRGSLQVYLGAPHKGIEVLEKALKRLARIEALKPMPDDWRPEQIIYYKGVSLHNLGVLYRMLGDYEQASRLLQQNILFQKSIPGMDIRNIRPSLEELGKVYFMQGDFLKALNQFNEGLSLLREAPVRYPKLEARFLNWLARVQFTTGNISEAEELVMESIPIGSQPSRLVSWELLVKIALRQKNYVLADSMAQKVLARAATNPLGNQPIIADLQSLLAISLQEQGYSGEAMLAMQEAFIPLGAGSEVGESFFLFPEADSLQFPLEAVELLKQKAALSDALLIEGLLNEAEHRSHNEKAFQLALTLCKQQVSAFRTEDAKLFWADKVQDIVHEQVALQAKSYQKQQGEKALATAFQAAEILKAAVLKEAIQDSRSKELSYIPSSLNMRARDLKLATNALERSMREMDGSGHAPDSLKSRLLSLQRRLSLTEDSIAHYVSRSPLGESFQGKISISEVQRHLESDQGLVQYILTDSLAYAWVIRPQDSHFMALPVSAQTIRTQIDLHIGLLRSSDERMYAALAETAFALYQALLEPLGNLPKRIIIVPDGSLFQLPFSTLLQNKPFNEPYGQWDWLIRAHSVSYSPSAAVWLDLEKEKTKRAKRWLGVAPVTFEKSLMSLHESEREIESMKNHFGDGTKGYTLTHQQASKGRLLATLHQLQPVSILHLSTHATSNGNYPRDSWLAFAGEGDTARLYLDELYAVSIPSELVVLSACETQAGSVNKGEGIMSLARAFTYAGSKSVLATLWPTNEGASQYIMERFYFYLGKGEKKDLALQKAQLDYLDYAPFPEDKLTPGYWAPFIITGNMKALSQSLPIWAWGCITAGIILAVILFWRFIQDRLTVKN